jgi:hypothetical protein
MILTGTQNCDRKDYKILKAFYCGDDDGGDVRQTTRWTNKNMLYLKIQMTRV